MPIEILRIYIKYVVAICHLTLSECLDKGSLKHMFVFFAVVITM